MATRYCAKEKRKADPNRTTPYDNNAKCRAPIRGKKWCACTVTSWIDESQQCTQLHTVCEHKSAMDRVAFRRSIAHFCLERFAALHAKTKEGDHKVGVKKSDLICFHTGLCHRTSKTRCAHCHRKTAARSEERDKGQRAVLQRISH